MDADYGEDIDQQHKEWTQAVEDAVKRATVRKPVQTHFGDTQTTFQDRYESGTVTASSSSPSPHRGKHSPQYNTHLKLNLDLSLVGHH